MTENNSNKDKHLEKRKYPRLPVRIKLECELSQTSVPSVYGLMQFNSKNISSGGIFLEGIKDLPEGQILNLDFSIPESNKPVTVKGLVMWSDHNGSGIRFLTLGIEDFEMISEFVNASISDS